MKYAMVCASNMNRSMAAHELLAKNGFDVSSFGVGGHVKLPGPSAKEPNVYDFGTPYETIFNDLCKKDPELYKRNGLLPLLQRNMGVKKSPERWQNCKKQFDVAITFEQRIMDQLVEDMNSRPEVAMRALLILNLDVTDNREEAAIAAPQALKLCQMLEEADDWEDEIDEIVARFERETGRRPTYTICWY